MQVDDSALARTLAGMSDVLYLEKGELFIHQGDKQEDFLFLVSGVFRGFYLDMNGKEITDCFGVIPGTPAMSASISNTASPISIEAATECVLVRLPGRELLPLDREQCAVAQDLQRNFASSHSNSLGAQIRRQPAHSTRALPMVLEKYPGLIDRISNKHIATFLGMSPVTFSRIRATLRDQG